LRHTDTATHGPSVNTENSTEEDKEQGGN